MGKIIGPYGKSSVSGDFDLDISEENKRKTFVNGDLNSEKS